MKTAPHGTQCSGRDAALNAVEVIRTEQAWLSIKSASTYTDLSVDSIRKLINRGDLTAHRPVSGRVLIKRSQLDALIDGSTLPARPNGRGVHRRRQKGG